MSAGSSQAAVYLNYATPPPLPSPHQPPPSLPQVTMDQIDCSLLCSKAYHWLRAGSERARLRRGPPLCLSSLGGPSAPPCGPAPGGPRPPRAGPRWGGRGCGDGGGDGGLPDTTQVIRRSRQASVHVSTGQLGCRHALTHTQAFLPPSKRTHTHTYTGARNICSTVRCNKVFHPGDLGETH